VSFLGARAPSFSLQIKRWLMETLTRQSVSPLSLLIADTGTHTHCSAAYRRSAGIPMQRDIPRLSSTISKVLTLSAQKSHGLE